MEENTRVYELGYLLVPTMPEGEVAAKVASLQEAIAAVGGTIKSEGHPEFIDLAYRIEKNVASKKMKWTQGYFGWLKFEAAPEELEGLKKMLDGNLDLIRYILIKTSVDNTIVFKKPKVEPKRDTTPEVEEILEDSSDELEEDHEKLPDLEEEESSEAETKGDNEVTA